jgi:FlaA1/EpsC-like NDP-sugar epimerase
MTRFNIPLEEGVEMVFWALEHALGGEILVPKIPSYRIGDVAEAIGPNCKQEIVGIRPGEKLHEEMISENDAHRTYRFDDHYVIAPSMVNWGWQDMYASGNKVADDFSYCSDTNDWFFSVAEIRELLASI